MLKNCMRETFGFLWILSPLRRLIDPEIFPAAAEFQIPRRASGT
jgi:hypothetical protein